MSLRIGDALSRGANRTFDRNGLLLVGAFVVFGFANAVVSQSFLQEYSQFVADQYGTVPGGEGPGSPGIGAWEFGFGQTSADGLALPLPAGAALALSLAFVFVQEALRIVSIRVFASTETDTIPRDLVRRNLPWAVLNSVVAGVIILIATGIGLVAFVFPGVYLAMSFYFVRPVIALEDETMFDAMGRAWDLSHGNRLDLFGLGVGVWFVGLLAGIPSSVVSFVDPFAGTVLSIGISAFVTVFGIAATTHAFEQVRDADASQP